MKSTIEQTQEQLNEKYEFNLAQIDVFFSELIKGIKERESCVKNHLAELHDAEQQRLIMKMDTLYDT